MTKSFEDLFVWQVSHKLILDIYKKSIKFPDYEKFGISNQIRRSSVSITNNIAEGYGRRMKKDKFRFYQIAFGSLKETQNLLRLCKDLNYITCEEYNDLVSKSQKAQQLLLRLLNKMK